MSSITHVISVPLVPDDAATAVKLRAAIDELRAADPTLSVAIGPVDQIELRGFSEQQMDDAVDILKRGKGLKFQVGHPQVRYCETISKMLIGEYVHNRPSGPPVYAKVRIRFEPGARGSGFVFENTAAIDAVPDVYVRGVEQGLVTAKGSGVIAGFPVIDLKCTLIGGGYHDIDSNVMAFDIAARACFRETLPKAGPRLLEPMMNVEVVTPPDHIGDVAGDLNIRRGQVQGMDPRDAHQVITALVPLASLIGYPSTLEQMTQGRANCTMAFSHYEQAPPAVGMRA